MYSPNKGGTTEGGFFLIVYRIASVIQDCSSCASAWVPKPRYLDQLPIACIPGLLVVSLSLGTQA